VALTAVWQKSTLSEENGCLEARCLDRHYVEIRDSKDPDGPILKLDFAEWNAFTAGVRNGEFDMPLGR
jgi:hypothetical protein